MDVYTMVVVIVALSVGARVASSHLHNRRLELERGGGALRDELDALRERVRVLEEIVTDSRYHLKAEFDRLERNG
jgi:hypothetical protein